MENNTTITVIPKKEIYTININSDASIKRRVAAYARVSTDLEDQKNSFNAQLEEYQNRISRNPNWEFVKLYSDEGLSGTSIKKRKGFQEMIHDALHGKIDLILVKSISRFARNTVDCLKTVRELRKKNVEVFFDKENISTNDTKIDMMLTIFASFAQEESKSISENVKWGVRKRMAKGQRKMNVSTTLGYKEDDLGNIIVDESTKDIVIKIFNLYAAGYKYREIAKIMTEAGYKTGCGHDEWKMHDVEAIITNEKYVGDFTMQKTVVVDFLDHRAVKNDGIEEKYVFKNHHQAIIDREKFNEIQMIKRSRYDTKLNNKPSINLLAGIFYCEHCLRPMKAITLHPGKKYARRIYTCKVTYKSSINFIKCDANSVVDFELVNTAITRIFHKFYEPPKDLDSTITESYQSAVSAILDKIESFRGLIAESEEKMRTLIKLQMSEKDITKYQSEFNVLKENVNFYKEEIVKLRQSIGEENKQYQINRKICEYIATGTISHEVLSSFIRGAIRRKDNSVRFIISDEQVAIDGTTIDALLEIKSIYSDSVVGVNSTLQFDVIKLGGKADD